MQALVDVDLDVPAGQVTALAGDNGAGQVGADQVHRRDPRTRQRPDLVGGRAGAHPDAAGRRRARDRDRVPGPRALRQPRHRPEHVPRARTCAPDRAGRGRHGDSPRARRSRSLAVTTVRSIRQPVASLSGGQRQSVAIAKAVLWNSKLVIMDEPTAALGVDPDRHGARARAPAGRPGHRRADRVPQPERRVRGGRPDRGAAPRARWSRSGRSAELDRQIVVDLMTTGASTRDATLGLRRSPDVTKVDEPASRLAGPAAEELTRRLDAGDRSPSRRSSSPDSVAEYLRASFARIRGGRDRHPAGRRRPAPRIRSLFQSLNSHFLTAGNLVNLLVQGAVFTLLAMGEVFALLLGEIDLSIGFVAGARRRRHGRAAAKPTARLAVVGGDRRRAAGLRRDRAAAGHRSSRALGLPSFVVTLAGLLVLAGRHAADPRQRRLGPRSATTSINDIASGNLTPVAGWIVMLVDRRALRRASRGGATRADAPPAWSRPRRPHAR